VKPHSNESLKDYLARYRAEHGTLPPLAGGAGTNIDPHDVMTFPAGEDLSAKQFFMVTINTEGKVVLAKAGEPAFSLLNNPKSGEAATVVVPLQTKAPVGEEVKPGWKLKVNNEGKLVKATEEKHVCAIALELAKNGAICSVASFPAGATG
jgi:hypothetical protein